jgi:hypothetical protein
MQKGAGLDSELTHKICDQGWLINISTSTRARPAEFPFMRQSVAPVSQSARLLEKKKEFHAVSALEKATALYLERIEGLRDDCDIMANAGEGWSASENGS